MESHFCFYLVHTCSLCLGRGEKESVPVCDFGDGIILELNYTSKPLCSKCNDKVIQFLGVHVLAILFSSLRACSRTPF